MPDRFREGDAGKGFSGQLHELGTKDKREGTDRDQEIISSWQPVVAVGRESSCGNQTMDMGMVEQCPGPGMEDRDDTYSPSEITRIGCKFRQGVAGRFDEDGIKNPLMAPEQGTKFLGEGEDEVEVGNRQKLLTSFFKPVFLIGLLALGAAAVLTGVVGIAEGERSGRTGRRGRLGLLSGTVGYRQKPADGLGAWCCRSGQDTRDRNGEKMSAISAMADVRDRP